MLRQSRRSQGVKQQVIGAQLLDQLLPIGRIINIWHIYFMVRRDSTGFHTASKGFRSLFLTRELKFEFWEKAFQISYYHLLCYY